MIYSCALMYHCKKVNYMQKHCWISHSSYQMKHGWQTSCLLILFISFFGWSHVLVETFFPEASSSAAPLNWLKLMAGNLQMPAVQHHCLPPNDQRVLPLLPRGYTAFHRLHLCKEDFLKKIEIKYGVVKMRTVNRPCCLRTHFSENIVGDATADSCSRASLSVSNKTEQKWD